jgi:hypothetical protein
MSELTLAGVHRLSEQVPGALTCASQAIAARPCGVMQLFVQNGALLTVRGLLFMHALQCCRGVVM